MRIHNGNCIGITSKTYRWKTLCMAKIYLVPIRTTIPLVVLLSFVQDTTIHVTQMCLCLPKRPCHHSVSRGGGKFIVQRGVRSPRNQHGDVSRFFLSSPIRLGRFWSSRIGDLLEPISLSSKD